MVISNKNEIKSSFLYVPFLRNVGIIAHIDSGKTTTTERILYLCKQIHKIGEVHEGSTQTDFLELERERGITICSAAVTVSWTHVRTCSEKIRHKLNIIDTPGHLDFKAEVERCLRILDGVVLVMDGKEGVESQTETVWKQADKYCVPRIVFVNKMDSVEDEDRFYKCLESMRDRLQANPIPLQIPIGAGRDFKGVVDIVEKKAYYFQFGDKDENFVVDKIPDYLLERVNDLRQSAIESVIVFDEQLGIEYLEQEGKRILEPDELRFLLRKAALTGKYFPVFCGSAYRDVGINLLLDGVLDYLPSPKDIEPASVYLPINSSKEEEKKEEEIPVKKINYFDPVSYLALAFKTVIDEVGNTLTFVRVYSGQIKVGGFIYNVNKRKEERVSTLVIMNADEETRIDIVRAGEIAVIKGLKYTRTGDTFFSEKKEPLILKTIIFDKPVISKAFVPHTSKDGEKLVKALKEMCFEDPSLEFYKDDRSGQIVVQGMGTLHLEVLEETLRRNKKYKLNISTEEPKIAYKETIGKKCETWTRYKKQSGGHGHFADINLLFEPNPGKGFEFLNKVRGEAVSKINAEAVGKGLKEAFSNGLLLGYSVVDVKVSLLDGLQHVVDSSDKDFKQAAIIACRENKDKLGLTLLEPIMHVLILIPKEYFGGVLANLGSLRMNVENTETTEERVRIVGRAPLEKVISYSTTLRQLTKGRGNCDIFFSHYQEVPSDVLQRIIKEHSVL